MRGTAKTTAQTQGFILIAVLWITAVLSILALGYATTARLKGLTALNLQSLERDDFLLQSGLAIGYHEFQKYRANQNLFKQKEELEALTDERLELWYPRSEPFLVTVQDTELQVRLLNAAGRFNINQLTAGQWRKVLTWCGLDDETEITSITNSILDWVDRDGNHRVEGAENDYYQSLERPYICKNGPFESLEELLLVRGVTPELFLGSSGHPGLRDFLTLYGEALQLDINTAPVQAFALVEDMPLEVVQEIVAYRQEQPVEKMSDLADIVPPEHYSSLTAAFAVHKVTHLTISVSRVRDNERDAPMTTQRTYQVSDT
ncbi:MAG: general secretion pathway protein GspK [Desulfohalobiaceae bacterium]